MNRVIVGCHIDLDNRAVKFKTGPGHESESPPASVPESAKGLCPLIGVWDASCKITLNTGESGFAYEDFVERMAATKPYRDSVQGACDDTRCVLSFEHYSPLPPHPCPLFPGNSPQLCAAEQGHWDVCKLLLEKYGASAGVIGSDGSSLLHWFVKHDNAEARDCSFNATR